jgi:large repetitive protein
VHQGNASSSDLSFDLELSGTPAIVVRLESPFDGATGVTIPAMLSATATHPDGSPMDLGFYGRPAPSGTETPEFQLIQQNLGVLSGEYTSAQWDGLADATTYEWYAVASDGVTEATSEVRTFSTLIPTTAPAAPTDLAAVARSTSEIRLTWVDHADNEAGFDVESSVADETSYGSVGTVGPDTTSIDVTALLPDTLYYYRVRAYNVVGTSDYAPSASAKTYALPQAYDQAVATPEDTPLSITLTGTSPQGLPLSYVIDTPPLYGSLGGLTGNQVVYTPDANTHGDDAFTFYVSDGEAVSAPATVTITIQSVNDVPVAQPDTAATLEGVAVNIDVLANDTDADGDILSIGSVTAPASGSVVINPDETITYFPDPGFSGSDSFTYTAYDGEEYSLPATVSVEVNRPVLFYDGFESGDLVAGGWSDVKSISEVITGAAHDGTYGLQLKKAGSVTKVLQTGGAPQLQISYWRRTSGLAANEYLRVEIAQDGGAWSLIDQVSGSSGWIELTHDLVLQDGASAFALRFSLYGNGGNDIAYLDEVEVTGGTPNSPPIAGDDAYTMEEDGTLTVDAASGVLANDTDAEGNTLYAVLVQDVASGILTLQPDGSFTYTPAPDAHGVFTFTYAASDGVAASDPATVTITVNAVNDAPVAVDDSATTPQDTAVLIDVLANDTDVELDPLTVISISVPAHGTAVPTEGGITYTPNTGFTGTDSFTYTVSDGILSDVATVTIEVTRVNSSPVAADDAYTVAEDAVLTIDAPGVLGNDSDPDGDALTAVLVAAPANGSLTLNADGSFAYTPNADFAGTDSFTYMANDGLVDSAPATVTITVNPVNDAPVALDDAYSVAAGGTLIVDAAAGVLANDTDADADLLTAVLGGYTGAGTLALAGDGSFTYTPAAEFTGTDSFTYIAQDGQGGSATATVTITVEAAGEATMHVASILVMAQDLGKGLKTGYAEVVIVDGQGNPVAGATVTGTFTEDIQSTQSGVTGADGMAVIQSAGPTAGRCHLTFTVDGVALDGYTYDPAANVETSDKNY